MPQLDALPGEIDVPTRDDLIAKYKRDRLAVVPSADPQDPQIDVDARVSTDTVFPLYAQSQVIGSNCVLEDATGIAAVSKWGSRFGVEGPEPATGGIGFGQVQASAGGFKAFTGDQLLEPTSNTSYQCTITRTVADGDHIPVSAIDTGPATNLPSGTVLNWKSPRPGSGPSVTVVEQSDGNGLEGGHDQESPAEYQARIQQQIANPGVSGNDAQYQQFSAATPDVSIQQVFTYPAIKGTGTTAVCATAKPSRPGASRILNAAQIAAIEANVVGKMPLDDGAFFCAIVEENADVVYRITWDENAVGWADVVPWPPYYPPTGAQSAVVVDSAASATSFVLRNMDASPSEYASMAAPQPGQTIAFYNSDEGEFSQKRILTVTGTGPWTIAVDTSNGASDTLYAPIPGQRANPWSDSLDLLIPALLAYFDGLGPGEQQPSFYDAGRRQRRQPQAPSKWPYALTRKGLEQVLDIDAIEDGSVVEGDGISAAVGIAGTVSFLLALRYVSFFPE